MDCSICLGEIEDNQAVSIPCGHIFCEPCLSAYSATKRSPTVPCPTCRQSFTKDPVSNTSRYYATAYSAVRRLFISSSRTRTPTPSITISSKSPGTNESSPSAATAETKHMQAIIDGLKAELQVTKAMLQGVDYLLNEKEDEVVQLLDELNGERYQHEQTRKRLHESQDKCRTLAARAEAQARRLDDKLLATATATAAQAGPGKAVYQNTPLSQRLRMPSAVLLGSSPIREVRQSPTERPLRWGTDIKWRGYDYPKHTPVPECTALNGVHDFTGRGTNGYQTKFTCKICQFRCSESRR